MNVGAGESLDSTDDDAIEIVPFGWWQRARRAEHRKLMSHIVVLRRRVRWLRATSPPDGTPAGVELLVDRALDDRSWCQGGELAHRYADSLEELAVLIGNPPYLATVLRHELTRPDPAERIKLADLFDPKDLGTERCRSCGGPPLHSPKVVDPVPPAQMLRLLFQKRADAMRHDRLMMGLRQYYLPWLATIVVLLLTLTIVTFARGHRDADAMAYSAQLLAVTYLGALGGTLSATLRLRDVAELNSFRAVSTYLLVQPLIGGAFGLVSWLISSSGMIASGLSSNWKALAVLSFAVGYSEPLFLGILTRVMGLTAPMRREAPGA